MCVSAKPLIDPAPEARLDDVRPRRLRPPCWTRASRGPMGGLLPTPVRVDAVGTDRFADARRGCLFRRLRLQANRVHIGQLRGGVVAAGAVLTYLILVARGCGD